MEILENTNDKETLKKISKEIRKTVIDMVYKAKSRTYSVVLFL